MIKIPEELPEEIDSIDLNQSIKHRLIERYGCKVGKKLACCIQNCLIEGNWKRKQVIACIKECLAEEIKEDKINEENITRIWWTLGFWHTVG